MRPLFLLIFQIVTATVAHAQTPADEGERNLGRGTFLQKWKKLNRAEKILAVMDPLVAYQVAKVAIQARDRAAQLYPHSIENGPGDAFRHAYWNALMKRRVGPLWAKAWADAHETAPAADTPIKVMRRKMDLFNNEAGREVATLFSYWIDDQELEDRVLKLLRDGDLRVVETAKSQGRPVDPALWRSSDNQRPY
ncbi:MAG: hypothetical protein JNL01_06705 [Bdellovibrionales bacterium]|nr:hypothetical protein [Bdellovibrionales bacterium]